MRSLPAVALLSATITGSGPASAAPIRISSGAHEPVFAGLHVRLPAVAGPTPWLNSTLPPDVRADLVEAQMTLDEALTLVDGHYAVPANFKLPPNIVPKQAVGSAGYVSGIPRLGIPALQESDAGIGVADPIDGLTGKPVRGTAGYSTVLPAGIATAATWNPQVAYSGGAMIGREAHSEGFNVLLGGTQDQHVISTVKHFAINDQETGRNTLSSDITPVAALASDLLAFEIGITTGDPGSVMCSYNRINHIYACSNNELLNVALKGLWGYPGWVLSDWGAVHATSDALAGLDQESGDYFDEPYFYFRAPLRAAIINDSIPLGRLYDMDHRILRSMFAKGLVDHPPVIRPIDALADANASQADAEQGAVLLKNAGGQLPLSRATTSIAVIGMHADVGVLEGGGSSEVWPVGGPAAPLDSLAFPHPVIWDPSSPLRNIALEAPHAHLQFNDGSSIAAAVQAAKSSSVAIVFAYQWLAESFDAANLSLPGDQDELIAAVAAANPHTVVVLETGDPVKMPWLSAVSGVLEAWYPGQRGGQAIARLLFGDVNPSGHLPITFPQSESQLPRPVLDGLANPNAFFDVNYNIEGADVGYKWFDRKHLTPLFPFGFGLSYTTFSYSNLQIAVGPSGNPVLSFDDTNTGSREGRDVAQLYLRVPDGQGGAPKRLVGWQKVDLLPGETRRVTIAADLRAVGIFDAASSALRVPGGAYPAYLGSSSDDRDVALTSSVTLPNRYLVP
jgi:beta-glucosidase